MKLKVLFLFLCVAFIAACVDGPPATGNVAQNSSGGAGATNGTGGKVKTGFSMATLREERWQRDRAAFEQHCKQMNVECVITVADNSADKQANDVDNLLTQGVSVLVIAPQNATQAASMVDKAKAQNVPVISYDRLINSDKIDVYISHQVPIIGRKIAEYALSKAPTGNYIMIYGDSTDNNAVIMKKEQLAVLQPAIDSKAIRIVADPFIDQWKAEGALKTVENALTQNGNNIQAVVVSNDGMAGGVISALEKQGLTGKVIVTGQDAQLDALQHIAEGKQSMTVYKPIIPLANAAVEAAIKLSKKESLTDAKPFKNDNIGKDINAILLEVQVVDIDNLMTAVIKDGYAKYEDVYANVAADKRPPKQ